MMEEIRDAFLVKGIQARVNSSKDINKIKDFWQRYWDEGHNGKLKISDEHMPLAVYSDFQGENKESFNITIGHITKDTKDNGYEISKIPKQKYKVFQKTGKMPDVVIELWTEIMQSNLERTYKYDLEEYLDFNTVKISIGIK